MTTDWFRQESWDERTEQEFFARLSRSRSQRDQYLVIQALTLAKAFPAVALRLADLYFNTKRGNFEDVRALSVKADAYLALDQSGLAIEAMKGILAIERAQPNYKTTRYVDYPFLVATQHISSEYHDALAVLEERKSDLAFPLEKFKWHASKSFIHQALCNTTDSKKHAALALQAAQTNTSGFRYHQDLGLVGDAYTRIIFELKDISVR